MINLHTGSAGFHKWMRRIYSRIDALESKFALAGIACKTVLIGATGMLSLSAGELSFDPVFSSHMVLQRGRPIPIYGQANPRSPVTVEGFGRSVETIADEAGAWKVVMDNLPLGSPQDLRVSSGNESVTLQDIVAGDVWLCGGQSNMAFVMKDSFGFDLEAASADGTRIRYMTVPPKASLEPVASLERGQNAPRWRKCDRGNLGDCSAVAYFFANEVAQSANIPIGLIIAAWGGTPIGAWTPSERLKSRPFAQSWIRSRQEASSKIAANPGISTSSPDVLLQTKAGTLFDGMIHPLGPFAVAGILWYQGEQDAGTGKEIYTLVLEDLIDSWRARFESPDAPFYFVQLPNYGDRKEAEWSRTREAQMFALRIPHTGMAVAIDQGERSDIHPRDKREIGSRLARLALHNTYGARTIVPSSPLYASKAVEGSRIRITFTEGTPTLRSRDGAPIREFEIAGPDRVFHPATVAIENNQVIVWCDDVPHPVAARYAWSNSPDVNLVTSLGLPVAPFRTDNWPESDTTEWNPLEFGR